MKMKNIIDHYREYIDHLRSMRYSRKAVVETNRMVHSFCLRFLQNNRSVTVGRLTRKELQDYHEYLLAKKTPRGYPLKASTINRYLIAVRGFLKYLAKQQLIRDTLVEALPYLKEPKRLPGNTLDHSQVKKLLAGIATDSSKGYRNRAILEVLYSTGIRAGELLSLDLQDIDLVNKTALINGKGDKERMVPIGRTALRHLETYILAVRPYLLRNLAEQALFIGRNGKRMSYERFRCMVLRVVEQAGLGEHITAHSFRRSCTTELIRSGANMYHVKELLGHESLDTLKHYAKLTITDLKKTHRKCHPRERDR